MQGLKTEAAGGAHTTIASYSVAVARALDACGIDSGRIFAAAGIGGELKSDPMSRLPSETMSRLYRMCVDVTNNPYFGLSVARHLHISNLHALGHALVASATLSDLCRRVERYMRLVSQVVNASTEEEGGEFSLRFEHLVDVCGETEDCFLGFLVLTMRQLYKPSFNPLRVELRRAMPLEGDEPYVALFQAPVTFGHAASSLVFERSAMNKPLDGACPELASVHDQIALGYMAKLDKNDVITGVVQKIIELLPDGECSRDAVAAALCLSPTVLHARLARRGTHFQELLDNTRKDLACNYLRQAGRTVTEVTFLLGFADTSNFTRAFRRWTGISPSEFRQQP